MGHRANVVLIERGIARAYSDQWAALACTLSLEDGAAKLKKSVPRLYEPTTELMDWAFAEGGFLIDYDERRCIAFGYVDLDLEEMPDDYVEEIRPTLEAFEAGFPAFVAHIAKGWRGFTMVWDRRGVDAFAEHLARRGITTIRTQPLSAPKRKTRPVEVIVDVSESKTKRARKPTTSALRVPAKEATVEEQVGKKPSSRAPSQKTPSQKTPSQKTPSQKAPSQKAPSQKARHQKAISKKSPIAKSARKPTARSSGSPRRHPVDTE